MGLMDRVRAQATQLAQQAQEAAQEGRARLDQAQAGRRGDQLLRQLGALVFAQRTGRGTVGSPAQIDQLISDISVHESQHGLNLADPPQPGFPQSPPADPGRAHPGPADPGPSDPGRADPGRADPGPADPGPSDPGRADPGRADPGPANSPSGDAGTMPPVDTTTSFFSVPDDEAPGGVPQS